MIDRGQAWLVIGLCVAGACASSSGGEAPADAPVPTESSGAESAVAPFARCRVNRCTFDFTVDLAPGGRDATVIVDRCVDPVPNCETNVGRLTSAGRAAAVAVRDTLSTASVEKAYGCPGCADGTVYAFTLPAPDGSVTEHVYDALHDSNVPDVLHDAHRLLQASERGAALCTPNENVELTAPCSPRR